MGGGEEQEGDKDRPGSGWGDVPTKVWAVNLSGTITYCHSDISSKVVRFTSLPVGPAGTITLERVYCHNGSTEHCCHNNIIGRAHRHYNIENQLSQEVLLLLRFVPLLSFAALQCRT